MAVNIGPKIGIDGEAEFRKELNNLAAQSKALESEMKAVTSAFDENDDSQEKLAAQSKILAQQLETQEKRVELLKKGVSAATEEFGEADSRTLKWKQALYDATTQMNNAKKSADDLGDNVEDTGEALKDAGDDAFSFGDALKANLTAGAIIEGVKGIADAIGGLADETAEYRQIMASLETSSQQAGYSAEETAQSYEKLYGVLGDDQTAATTVANLQAIGLEQKDLTKLTDAAIGAWATYGDSIPIDGLSEAINETIKVGEVTGTFADVLNWAGVSEDDFNEKLSAANTSTERANIVLDQLAKQGLTDAGKAWQQNNADLVDANENTLRWQENMAEISTRVTPVLNEATDGVLDIVDALLDLTEGVNFDIVFAVVAAVASGVGAYKGITTAITLAKNAQLAFNAAASANPVGLVAGAIAATVVGVVELTKALDEASLHLSETHEMLLDNYDAAVALAESSEEAKKEFEDLTKTWEDQNAQVELLTKRYGELTKSSSRTAEEELELQAVINGLNDLVPDLGLEYDKLTKSTNKSAEAVEEFAKASAADDQYIQVLEKRNEAQANLNAALQRQSDLTAEIDEIQEKIENNEGGYNYDFLKIKNDELDALGPAIENFNVLLDDYNAKLDELSGEVTEEYVDAAEERQAAIEAEAEASTEAYDSIYGAATDMFDQISTKSEISVEQMIENLQKNQQAVSDWADNLQVLAARGVDEGLLKKMQEMGPEAAGYVAEMVTATDEELAQMSALWSDAAEIASDALIDSIDAKTPQVEDAAQDMVDESMPNVAGYYDIGVNAGYGMGDGMYNMQWYVSGAAGAMARAARAAAERELDINSPSKVFEQIGNYTGEGFEIGFVDSMKQAQKAVEKAVSGTIGAVNGTVTAGIDFSAGDTSFSDAMLHLEAQRQYGTAVMEFAASRSPGSQISNSRSVQYNGGISINVQAAPGMNINTLVDEIERRLAAATERRAAVW